MAARILSVRDKASGLLEVKLSGGFLFFISRIDAELAGAHFDSNTYQLVFPDARAVLLHKSYECTEHEIDLLALVDKYARARIAAMRSISISEQGTRQLWLKLIQKGHDANIAKAIIQWMVDTGMINDRRYVQLYFETHLRKSSQYPAAIRAKLWPRIGLFENRQSIWNAALAAVPEDLLLHAIQMRVSFLLKELPQNANNTMYSTTNIRSQLKHEEFPLFAIDKFFDTWENDS